MSSEIDEMKNKPSEPNVDQSKAIAERDSDIKMLHSRLGSYQEEITILKQQLNATTTSSKRIENHVDQSREIEKLKTQLAFNMEECRSLQEELNNAKRPSSQGSRVSAPPAEHPTNSPTSPPLFNLGESNTQTQKRKRLVRGSEGSPKKKPSNSPTERNSLEVDTLEAVESLKSAFSKKNNKTMEIDLQSLNRQFQQNSFSGVKISIEPTMVK